MAIPGSDSNEEEECCLIPLPLVKLLVPAQQKKKIKRKIECSIAHGQKIIKKTKS